MANSYCANWDSYYLKDGTWIESICNDSDCLYCSKRPKKHSKKCGCKAIGIKNGV